jgi:Domain of unknown function (DUF4352)
MCAVRSRIMIVVLAALAAAIFGVTRLVASLGTEAEASQVASLGGLTAETSKAEWVGMDHDMSPNATGYTMPPAMMPGMPEQGEQRMSVSVTITNTGDQTRPLRPLEEFTLRTAKSDARWSAHSDSFGELPRLAPRSGVSGVLFFDLPPEDVADSDVWIEWSHEGSSTRLSVPLNGAVPKHQHNP